LEPVAAPMLQIAIQGIGIDAHGLRIRGFRKPSLSPAQAD
jgi:hypothetical protein